MAYRNYNPDALTVNHAEPEEAAQKLGGPGQSRYSDRDRERERERERDRQRDRERDRRDKPPPPLPSGSSGASRYGPGPPPAGRGSYGTSSANSYGYGTGPISGGPPRDHGRPPNPNYRPPTVAPRDGNDRDALWPMFRAVDKDGEPFLLLCE
jgi:peflin